MNDCGRGSSQPKSADSVLIEAVWTEALLSYARCFSVSEAGASLTEADLTEAQPEGDVLAWHKILLQLRDHYADPGVDPGRGSRSG